jgi:hypothetical protein
VTVIDRAELHALLEDGPHSGDELATWLEQPLGLVAQALGIYGIPICEKCDRAFLRKPGTAGRFCTRRCYDSSPSTSQGSNKGGRKPWADHEGRRAAIIRALTSGPLAIVPLSKAIGFSREVTKDEARALLRLGRVALLRRGGLTFWTLPAAVQKPAPAPRNPEVPADAEPELLDDEIEALDEDLEDLDVEPLEPPASSSSKPRIRNRLGRGQVLRQPHERPPSQPLKADTPPAWWATAKREGFSELAAKMTELTRSSKEARSVPFRILQ